MRFRVLLLISLASLAMAQTRTQVGGKVATPGYIQFGGTPAGGISLTFAGDLSGNSSTQQVIGILNHPLPTLTTGYIHWNGTAWVFDTPSGGGSGMVWPGAGIPLSTGAAWGTSFNNTGTNPIPATYLPTTITSSTTGNAATATALQVTPSLCVAGQAPRGILANGNATGCAVIGSGGGGSGTVSSGTVNQLAIYTAATTVGSDANLTDISGQLKYSGASGAWFTGPVKIDGTLSIAGPWFVQTPWPSSPMGAGTSSTGSQIGISNDGNFYIGVGTGAPSEICTVANGVCGGGGGGSMTWPTTPGLTVCTGTPCTAWTTSKASPTGTVVGTTDTQTLTNKTVDGVAPATFAFLDPTSSVQTQLNGKAGYPGAGIAVSTGSAWGTSLTAPTGAIVGTTDTQTLTNKTVDGVTPATFAFLDPTSSVQTQLNGKPGWPSGSAGIPNYTGSSAWGTSYNATNLIPGTFLAIGGGLTTSGGLLTTVGAQPYEIAITFNGTFPASQVFIRKPTSGASQLSYTIPTNCTNSVIVFATAATASTTITLLKNGTSFGTAAITSTGGSGNTTWTCTATTFSAGDTLTITAPASPDATAAGLGGSIFATR